MAASRKLWLLMLLCGAVVVLQYHVSSGWSTPAPSHHSSTSEHLVQVAVSRLQLDSTMTHNIGEKFIREIAFQMGRELLANCEDSIPQGFQTGLDWPEPTIYVVTPTYRRPEQVAELTRLAQTLMHVRNLVWLVVEDARGTSPAVYSLLERSGINYKYLAAAMPDQFKRRRVKPRGVSNRNRALQWIRSNASAGVLYFADDDNTYDIELFNEIRTTKKVSMFPVGLCTKYGVSSPIIDENGTFTGFYDGWIGGRKFPVDMAGFALNLDFLFKRPRASMPYRPGFEEDGFLRSLAPFEPGEAELKADKCTKIYVWHTQTKKNEPSTPVEPKKYNNTNIEKLKLLLV